MFSKNLKYYRLKKGMTKKELANRVDILRWQFQITKTGNANQTWN